MGRHCEPLGWPGRLLACFLLSLGVLAGLEGELWWGFLFGVGAAWGSGPQMATLCGSVSDPCLSRGKKLAEAARTGTHSPGRGPGGWTALTGPAQPLFVPTEQGAALAVSAPAGSGRQLGQCGPDGLVVCEPWWMTPGLASRGSESSWVPVLPSCCCYVTSPCPSPRNSLDVVCPGPPPEGQVPRSVTGTLPHPARPIRPVARHVQDERGGPSPLLPSPPQATEQL